LGQKVFHISEAQAESVVEPNRMADNIRWKSVAAITGQVGFHLLSLLGSPQLDNTSPTLASESVNVTTAEACFRAKCLSFVLFHTHQSVFFGYADIYRSWKGDCLDPQAMTLVPLENYEQETN
jgi:hypothetical protein